MEKIKRNGSKIEIDRNDLAAELKLFRYRHRYTQQKLAEQWGVSRWSIMRAEAAGEIGVGLLIAIYSRLAQSMREEGER